jgi:hypothetical protein
MKELCEMICDCGWEVHQSIIVAGVCVVLSHVELRVVVFYVEYFTSLVARDSVVVKAL